MELPIQRGIASGRHIAAYYVPIQRRGNYAVVKVPCQQ